LISAAIIYEGNGSPLPAATSRRLRPAERDRRTERNTLVEEHLDCVDHFERVYANRGVAADDLRQTAFVALVQAADRFDPTMGVAFTTYASRTIDGTIKRYFRDRTWMIRPPRAAQELHLNLRRADDELYQRLGRRPTVAELAREVDADIDHVLEELEAGSSRSVASLDKAARDDDGYTLHDSLGAIDGSFDSVDASVAVDRALGVLDERSREAIYLRFFEHLNQDEIAARLGISQSYLSRVLRAALQTMRAEIESD
jgi:RNA polymerase sigma-B factor